MSLAYAANALVTVDGLPAHPLLADAVAVLLPLAALCSVGIAVHGGIRRRFGWPVLALVAVAVIAVPPAQSTGHQLAAHLPAADALVSAHVRLGAQLLPYALGFGVAVVILLVAGRLADRERAASTTEDSGDATVSTVWRRIAMLASVLVVGMAVVTTVQVVRIGTAGAQAVWHDVTR